MKIKWALGAVTILLGCFVGQVLADGRLLSWSTGDVQGVTEESFNDAKKMTVAQILQKSPAVRSWAEAYLLMVAATSHKEDKQLLAGLTSQLTNASAVALQGTSRLIIWERITSGKILFEAKGYQSDDDLFSAAGRANWMLRNLTRKNFGFVHPSSTAGELAQLQQKWQRWLAGEQVDEYKNPYEAKEKGFDELHSPQALEAMIVAIGPNPAKDRLTKDCLRRLYQLDKMPADPGGQPRLCDPDTLTHRYLAILTGIKDPHDDAWWKKWWETNRSKLEWKPETGSFAVKS